MKIKDLGERAFIQHITGLLSKSSNIVVSAGEDDCAVLDTGGDNYLLVPLTCFTAKLIFRSG